MAGSATTAARGADAATFGSVSLRLNARCTATKNTGTISSARITTAIMPPITPVPSACWLLALAPCRNDHRRDAEDEGKAGHQDRPEAQPASFDGGVPKRLALLAQRLGELDDENAVLGCKADDRHDADREIDVVRQAAQHGGDDRAEDAERNGQQHRQRYGPAFVERGEHEEDQQHGQASRSGACEPDSFS